MIKTIITTIISLFRLCVFQGSPAELPYSRPFLMALILFTVIMFPYPGLTPTESILGKSLATAVLAGVLYGLLWRKKQVQRLHKALLAWLGTDIISDCIGLALFGTSPTQEPNVGTILFLIWLLLVKSYILKRTFMISMAQAFLLLLGILITTALPLVIILGPQLPA